MSTLSLNLIGNDISGSILMSAVLMSACILKKRKHARDQFQVGKQREVILANLLYSHIVKGESRTQVKPQTGMKSELVECD